MGNSHPASPAPVLCSAETPESSIARWHNRWRRLNLDPALDLPDRNKWMAICGHDDPNTVAVYAQKFDNESYSSFTRFVFIYTKRPLSELQGEFASNHFDLKTIENQPPFEGVSYRMTCYTAYDENSRGEVSTTREEGPTNIVHSVEGKLVPVDDLVKVQDDIAAMSKNLFGSTKVSGCPFDFLDSEVNKLWIHQCEYFALAKASYKKEEEEK